MFDENLFSHYTETKQYKKVSVWLKKSFTTNFKNGEKKLVNKIKKIVRMKTFSTTDSKIWKNTETEDTENLQWLQRYFTTGIKK